MASSNAAASASFASLPKLTGLSAGQEPSDPGVGEGTHNVEITEIFSHLF